MKKNRILASTLIAASFALSVPALAGGSGASSDPYTGSVGGLTDMFNSSTFPAGSTVYIDGITDGYFGTSNSAYTCVADINIGSGGMTLNNGYSSASYTFTGKITGTGNWTFSNSNVSQDYIFLGDMSGYSGNIDYSTERASDANPSYFYFGNGGQAATDTNVSGTGSITQHGNITFNYSSYANENSQAITIGNSSLKAETMEFAGSVNYTVSSTTVTGYDSSSSLTISNTGTTTFNGTVSGFGTVTVDSGSTLAVGSTGSLDLTGATVDLSSTIQNSGTVTIAGTSFVLDNLTKGTYGDKDYYVIVSGTGNVSYSGNISFTHEGITLNWEVYNSDGYFVVYGDHTSELTWAGTGGNNTWSTSSTDTPWSSSEGTTADSGFNNGDSVTFSSSTAEKSVIVSGAVEAASMTVSEGGYTFSSDSTTGGTIKANSFTFNAADGTSVTIAVSDAEFGGISLTNHGDDKTSDAYKALVFGNGIDATTATVTGTLSLLGQSEVQVAENSTLTVNAITSGGGYHTSISGGGTLIATSITQNASGNVFDISIANLQVDTLTLTAGTLTFSGGNADIGSLTFEQGTLTFTGGGTYNIGTYQNSATDGWVNNSKTFAIGDNTTVTAETFSVSWHETVTFGANSVLTVTGELSLHTNDTETFSGGTINAEKLYVYNGATASFSNGTLNIGSGGIVNTDNWANYDVVFGDGLTVGVYAGTGGNTSWSTDVAIQFTKSSTGTGTTFYTEANQSITLSGTLTGAGFSNTGSGTLTLSGTVELSSAITNSGNIVINSNTQFVLDNLKSDGHGTYVIISNVDSGTIQGWDSLTKENFSFSDGTTINSVDVTTSGQITISTSAKDLIWNGGTGTWDTTSTNWTISGGTTSSNFSSGDYVTFTGSSGDTKNTITVNGNVSAAYVTVEGGTYSFSGNNITVKEYFVINSGAEVDLDGSVVYADFVVNGTLKLDVTNGYGDSGEVHGTITINNGGRVELDNGDVTGYGDGAGVTQITINAGGTLYVGTTANQTLGSCDLILVGGTIDGVDGSNLDLFHSSTLIATAAEGATAEDPTVSTIKGAMLTSRNDDGTTEVRVEENAVLDVQSGFWSGPGGDSSYNGNIEKTGAGTLEVSGYFAINNGQLLVDAGTVILSGTAGGTSMNYGFASAITVAEGAVLELAFQSGDATVGSVTSSGTLKITGTTLTVTGATSITDLTLADGSTLTLSQGNNTSNTSIGTLTVSGDTAATITGNYYEHVSIGALAGSGTLVLGYTASDDHAMIYELTGNSGDTPLTSSFTGTIDLTETNSSSTANRGVTLIISDGKVASGAVIEMGTDNSSGGALALGVNASTVEIAGLVSASDHTGADIIYSGSVSIGTQLGDAGASLIDYASEGNKNTFTSVGTSRNTLVLNISGSNDYSFSGVIMDKLNIEKKGTGTQSIEFQLSKWTNGYYFDGTIAVTEGTLNLSGIATNSSGITVDSGATLNIANDITLTKASDLSSCSSTISGNLGLSGTLTVASDATLEIGSTASVTINSAIVNEGSITIANGASIVVGSDLTKGTYTDGTNGDVGYYVLISGSGDDASVTLNGSVTFVIGDESISLSSLIQRYADSDTWNIYSEGGYLVIYEATSDEKPASIYWAGSDGNSTIWVADNDSIIDWSGSDGGEAVYSFADGDAVIFGAAVESKTVAVSGTVAPGSITINGEYTFNKDSDADSALVQTSELTFGENGKLTIGDDVTVQITETLDSFSADGTIVGTGTLQLELSDKDYSATVSLGTQNEFAGTVYITAGNFTLNGSDIGNGTFRLGDGVNMQVTSSGTEVGNNFILEGTSQVHVNENDSLTISGSISGVETDGVMGGVFDRQGAGDLTIAGNVDIGTFVIDSSGSGATSSTTFSGSSVNIGTLDVTYAESVVFSGGAESSLNIGKLTFEAAGVIEFKNGGTVGTISYDKQSSSGIIRVSGGTLEVGTITNTYTDVQAGNETLTEIEVGTGAVLHAETITIAPGNAGSVYSTISGIEEGVAGTVIADTFNVGSAGGASVEISDVTLVVGGLSFGTGGNSNFNLYLKNATLGFTKDVTISATTASGSNSRIVLGGFASGNSTATGEGTTTTINTSKYDVETGAFTSTGVTVTISQIISGQGKLAVEGVGKLILSAANTYSGGTTIASGATVVAQDGSALGSGNVTVNSGATLELDTHVTVDTASSTVTFAAGASIVLGGDLLQEIIASADTQEAVAVITANTITFGDVSVSDYSDDSDGLTTIVNQYVTSNQYGITWSWSEGTLWAVASIPEPSTFGVLFGLGALGLVATRRRRRKAA